MKQKGGVFPMLPILLMIDEITQEDERELLRRLFFT